MVVKGYCKEERNLEPYHKRTDTIQFLLIPFVAEMPLAGGSIITISAAYTITQILSKSTVW